MSKNSLLFILYAVLAALPVAVAWLLPVEPAGFWTELGSVTGMLAMMMMALQFLSSGRFEPRSFHFSIDVMMGLHKQTARVLLILILVHPLLFVTETAMTDFGQASIRLFTLLAMPKYLTGVLALVVLACVIVLSVLRTNLPFRYEAWRLLHFLFGFVALVLTLDHIMRVGAYADDIVMQIFWYAIATAVALTVLYLYTIRPVLNLHHLYEISAVKIMTASITRLRLRSLRKRFAFRAGQFAWITTAPRFLPLYDHPFSFSSSPNDTEIEFLIRNAGDFTSQISKLKSGTRVSLDGPHGDFYVPHDAKSILLVAGGIGVAPIMSILKDSAHSHDERPIRLIYAVAHSDDVLDIDALANTHALSNFKATIFAERGHTKAGLLPGRPDEAAYAEMLSNIQLDGSVAIICGPAGMMAYASDTLENLGLKREQIRYEKFDYASTAQSKKDRAGSLKLLFALMGALIFGVAFALRSAP